MSSNRARYSISIWLASLTFLIIAIVNLKHFPNQVERFYSRGVYPRLSALMQSAYNFIPFSVGDLFYIVLIACFIFFLAKLFRLVFSGKFKYAARCFLKLLIGLEIMIVVFYLFWGINYFRQPAAQRLNLTDTRYTDASLKLITKMLIDSANACRSSLSQADLHQTDSEIFRTAQLAVQTMSGKLPVNKGFHPFVKPSILSPVLNYTATAGYYNPFTSEAQINNQMPVFLKPVVACHEMAHQLGFNAENEANFAGFLAGISSPNRLLKYSAYYLGVAEFMHDVRKGDTLSYQALKATISAAVLNDFETDNQYWLKYQGKLGALSGILYDNYLKANKQPEGIRTYNLMIKLVMAWYRRAGLVGDSCVPDRSGNIKYKQFFKKRP